MVDRPSGHGPGLGPARGRTGSTGDPRDRPPAGARTSPHRTADPKGRSGPHRRRRSGSAGPRPPRRWRGREWPRWLRSAARPTRRSEPHLRPCYGRRTGADLDGAPWPSRAQHRRAHLRAADRQGQRGSLDRLPCAGRRIGPGIRDVLLVGSLFRRHNEERAGVALSCCHRVSHRPRRRDTTSPTCSPVQSSWVGTDASSARRRRPITSATTATTATSTPTPTGMRRSADGGSCIAAHRTAEDRNSVRSAHPERNHRPSVRRLRRSGRPTCPLRAAPARGTAHQTRSAGLTAATLTVASGLAGRPGSGRLSSRPAGRKSSAGSGGGSLRGRIETGSATTGYAPVCSRWAPLRIASSADSDSVGAALALVSEPRTKGRVTSVDFSGAGSAGADVDSCALDDDVAPSEPECGHGASALDAAAAAWVEAPSGAADLGPAVEPGAGAASGADERCGSPDAGRVPAASAGPPGVSGADAAAASGDDGVPDGAAPEPPGCGARSDPGGDAAGVRRQRAAPAWGRARVPTRLPATVPPSRGWRERPVNPPVRPSAAEHRWLLSNARTGRRTDADGRLIRPVRGGSGPRARHRPGRSMRPAQRHPSPWTPDDRDQRPSLPNQTLQKARPDRAGRPSRPRTSRPHGRGLRRRAPGFPARRAPACHGRGRQAGPRAPGPSQRHHGQGHPPSARALDPRPTRHGRVRPRVSRVHVPTQARHGRDRSPEPHDPGPPAARHGRNHRPRSRDPGPPPRHRGRSHPPTSRDPGSSPPHHGQGHPSAPHDPGPPRGAPRSEPLADVPRSEPVAPRSGPRRRPAIRVRRRRTTIGAAHGRTTVGTTGRCSALLASRGCAAVETG